MSNAQKKEPMRADIKHLRLDYGDLVWTCDDNLLKFQTTAELDPLPSGILIGQERAVMALELGLKTPGHIFVTGLSSIHGAFTDKVRHICSGMPDPQLKDVVCVYNFRDSDRPVFIHLPKGESAEFKHFVEAMADRFRLKIPEILNSDEFHEREKEIWDWFDAANKELFAKTVSVIENNIAGEIENVSITTKELGDISLELRRTQDGRHGVYVTYLDQENVRKPVTDDMGRRLSYQEFNQIEGQANQYSMKIVKTMEEGYLMPLEQNRKSAEKKVADLAREFVGVLFNKETSEFALKYDKSVDVLYFMQELREYTLGHINNFNPKAPQVPPQLAESGSQVSMIPINAPVTDDPFLPFAVNIVIDNSETRGMPVIVDKYPTPARIFGKIARKNPYSGESDDHTRVKLGTLAKANDGILIMPVLEAVFSGVLARLLSILSSGKLDVGESSDIFGYFSSNIQPSPIEINARVILVGDMHLYHILSHDDRVNNLVKTLVDFDNKTDQTREILEQQARLMSSFAMRGGMPSFSRDAVMAIFRNQARDAGERGKLSLDISGVKRLMEKSKYWANKEGAVGLVEERHVRTALENDIYMKGSVKDSVYKAIKNGIFVVDVEGKKVGEINALAVLNMPQLSFARPVKVTAVTYANPGGITNIEGQVGFSSPIHQKSFHILNAYFHAKYAKNSQINLGASVAFEQSYGPVDGDSATLPELYVIVSSLTDLPLRQDIAITGSMSQKGIVQPIGGENEKIEGFFDVLNVLGRIKKYDSDDEIPGVIVPRRNLRMLILREDVLEAVRADKFRIYAINAADEGLEILTGVRAGDQLGEVTRGLKKGTQRYPAGTINYMVVERLNQLKNIQNGGHQPAKK